jgi:hypothetical protein
MRRIALVGKFCAAAGTASNAAHTIKGRRGIAEFIVISFSSVFQLAGREP